jgi:signal transduction histidine kinase
MTRSTRSLRLRLALLFTVVGLIVLTLMVTSAVTYRRLVDDRAALVDRTDPALQHLGALLTAYVNQETGVRGFVLTRDEAFLEPYDQGLAADSAESAFLRQAMQGNAGLTRDLASVEQAAGRWHDRFASPAIAAARAGEDSFASDVALANSKALFDGVRAAVDTMQRDLEAARQREKDQLDATSNQLAALMVASAIVLVATGVLLWWALRRWVTDPLEAVGNDARTVTAGDLDHEVAPAGPPEIADLAGDIEAMRERIVRQLATVAASGEALQTANADLVRSNEELEQFAYVASHDLQEPLRKVASFCQLLEQRYGGQLDERGQQYIDFAVDGAKRMQNLINDLLAFSRVGRTTERFVPVELHTCVDGALRNLFTTIEETGASIDVEDALPVVDGDRGLLTALFQNLIGNSLKFRSEASPAVRITASQQDGEVTMAVADNGIGIDERFADRIFVIFQRLHGREAYDGTGIGLAMCRKIVEFHGGRIWLDTSYERGSRFCFTLPVAAEEA